MSEELVQQLQVNDEYIGIRKEQEDSRWRSGIGWRSNKKNTYIFGSG